MGVRGWLGQIDPQSLSLQPCPSSQWELETSELGLKLSQWTRQPAETSTWGGTLFVDAIVGHSWGPGLSTRADQGSSSPQFFSGARGLVLPVTRAMIDYSDKHL